MDTKQTINAPIVFVYKKSKHSIAVECGLSWRGYLYLIGGHLLN